jgi:hypothetical protein
MTYTLSTTWIKPGKSDRLRAWYDELQVRKAEAFQTLDNEGVRQEVAFILKDGERELLAVFLEVDKDMAEADAAFFSSPFKIDHEHAAVMDECTESGSRGRVHAELMYAFQNPRVEATS